VVVSEESAYTRQILVLLVFEEGVFITIAVSCHASELQDVEGLSSLADTFLTEEGWTTVFETDGHIAHQKEGREEDEAHE
jgi:hypothetical protein